MNYLNKNKSILKIKDTDNTNINYNLVTIDEEKINLITSRSNIPIKKSLSKKINNTKIITDKNNTNKIINKKTNSKKTNNKKTNSKKTNSKKTTINTNIKKKVIAEQNRTTKFNNDNNIDFPQGNQYKCIGPCFPANTLYYNPITLQAIKSKKDSCPIYPNLNEATGKVKIKDKCILNKNYNYENYDIFDDVVQVATSDNTFLEQIYNIKNIYDVELFLENDIKQLPNLSQKRIMNSIYKVYRDNDSFPSNNFISLAKNFIKKNYDIKIKSKMLLSKIMDNKHGKKWDNLFTGLLGIIN